MTLLQAKESCSTRSGHNQDNAPVFSLDQPATPTMKRFLSILLLPMLFAPAAIAQHIEERSIDFPDVPNYLTLVCDLHMHTVFSDGSVWPDIRVQEAQRDGLDAIAITEHLEYQPHSHDIPHPDRNRSYEIAQATSPDSPLIVINGSEITRSMPPGHANAIFLADTNPLLTDDPIASYREANRQDAFVFWNHPHWTSQRKDGVSTLTDMHRMLISEGLLHGIEIANEMTYSDEALAIALEHDLTMLGTSDIHGLVDWQFDVPRGGHRPVTLVFAEERSAESIKAGLRARRTVVWFDHTLIGREEHLLPLIEASVSVANAQYLGDTSVLEVILHNDSDATFLLKNHSDMTFHDAASVIELPPHADTRLEVKTLERMASVTLAFEVLSAVTAPGVHPTLTIQANPN